MADEEMAKWDRRSLIEKNAHLGRVSWRLIQAAGGKCYNGLHLLAVKPIEPLHDVVDASARLDIFEAGYPLDSGDHNM